LFSTAYTLSPSEKVAGSSKTLANK
jgi:hypothetical protein